MLQYCSLTADTCMTVEGTPVYSQHSRSLWSLPEPRNAGFAVTLCNTRCV